MKILEGSRRSKKITLKARTPHNTQAQLPKGLFWGASVSKNIRSKKKRVVSNLNRSSHPKPEIGNRWRQTTKRGRSTKEGRWAASRKAAKTDIWACSGV